MRSYQATVRAFEIGIAALTGTGLDRRSHGAETGAAPPIDPEIATALHDARDVIDTLARQAEFSNRLTRRTLYMACGAQAATIARSRGTLDMLDAVEVGATTERMFTPQLSRIHDEVTADLRATASIDPQPHTGGSTPEGSGRPAAGGTGL